MKSLRILTFVLVIGLLFFGCVDSCPSSCDDGNPCTDDFCSERTNYNCAHKRLDGQHGTCSGDAIESCTEYFCEQGSCIVHAKSDCTPDNGGTVSGEAEWTFIVYLDADNNLEAAGVVDFNEMEMAGSTEDVNIVVQMDRIEESDYYSGYDSSNGNWADAKRFYILQDTNMERMRKSELELLGEVNMGSGNTLEDFLLWAVDEYPAKHYAVIIWDHGAGWDYSASGYPENGMIAFDDTSNGDGITLTELTSALSSMKNKIGRKIDIIGFDACLNGMHEVDYEIADYAHIRVSSEELVPGDGWDYSASLTALVNNPSMGRGELSRRIVADFERFYMNSGDSEMITLSAVDLDELGDFNSALDSFSLKASERMNSQVATDVGRARAYVEEYGNDEYGFIDIIDFVKILHDITDDPEIKKAAKAVVDSYSDSVILEIHGDGRSHSHGRSIYFPKTSSVYTSNYATDTKFATETGWGIFLKSYYSGQTADTTAPSVRNLQVSSEAASADNPLQMSATVSGSQITDVEVEVYAEGDAAYGDYVILLNYIHYIPPSYQLEDGSTIPAWTDGENPLDINWNAYGVAVEDDEGYLFMPLEPIERGSQYYFISGEYTTKGGISPVFASLVFDFNSGQLEYVWDHDNVKEIDSNIGDRFSAYMYIIDFDADDSYYVPGTELIYGESGFNLGYYPYPAGGYYLNIYTEDIAGQYDFDSVYVTVTDYAETGTECFDGTQQGYCSLSYPGYYCDAGELVYDEYCLADITCMDGTPNNVCSDYYEGYLCSDGVLEYSQACVGTDFCPDGSSSGSCSYYNGFACELGEYVWDDYCFDPTQNDDCADGTLNAFCSNENPGYYCLYGELIEDVECIGSCLDGTPNEYCSFTMDGYACFDGVLEQNDYCLESYGTEMNCGDGTQHGYCSLYSDGYWCNNGMLEYDEYCLAGEYGDNCEDGTEHGYCSEFTIGYGCWNGVLEPYEECGSVTNGYCEDGTEHGYCSNANPGYFCYFGELSEDMECIGSCSDGTPNGYCAYTMDGYACWDGAFEPDELCTAIMG